MKVAERLAEREGQLRKVKAANQEEEVILGSITDLIWAVGEMWKQFNLSPQREEIELKVDWEKINDMQRRLLLMQDTVERFTSAEFKKRLDGVDNDIKVLEARLRILRSKIVVLPVEAPEGVHGYIEDLTKLKGMVYENKRSLDEIKEFLSSSRRKPEDHPEIEGGFTRLMDSNREITKRVEDMLSEIRENKDMNVSISGIMGVIRNNKAALDRLSKQVSEKKPGSDLGAKVASLENMNENMMEKLSALSAQLDKLRNSGTVRVEPYKLTPEQVALAEELLEQNVELLNNLRAVKTEIGEIDALKKVVRNVKRSVTSQNPAGT